MRQLDGQWQACTAPRSWLLPETSLCCVEIGTRAQQVTARIVFEVAKSIGLPQTSRSHIFRGVGILRPFDTDHRVEI